MTYDFNERLRMSMESMQLETDKRTLKNYFLDAENVEKAGEKYDKAGIDYIVTLASGAKIAVDVKTREKGCSRYRKEGPELALEVWSQKYPTGTSKNDQPGWTLDSRKRCQYIMFKFDKSDCESVFILPFQQLRKAFTVNIDDWYLLYRHAEQRQATAEYISECVFVPAHIVTDAVREEFSVRQAGRRD